jgi:hypothetical protein
MIPDTRLGATEIWPRIDANVHLHLSGDAFDQAKKFAHRLDVLDTINDWNEVEKPNGASCGCEGRFEDRRVVQVSPLDGECLERPYHEKAASPFIEDAGKDGRAGKIRQAKPINRSGEGDQGRCPAITDRRVVFDRRLPPSR